MSASGKSRRRKLHPARRRLASPLLVIGAALLAGCHKYIPVEEPAAGSTVRVTVPVTSAVQDRNATTGTSASVEGVVVQAAPTDSLVLAISRRASYGAFRDIVRHDTISISLNDALRLEERIYAKNRSVVLGVGLTAVAVGLAAAAFGVGGGQQGIVPPDGGGTTRPVPSIPLFSISTGR